MAVIFRKIASTREKYPREIVQGMITAIQKLGKPKGPVQNLRPIILLSVLRKILAICLNQRITTKIDTEIPSVKRPVEKDVVTLIFCHQVSS